MTKIILWLFSYLFILIGLGVFSGPVFAGGLSADVARNAMCEDYYRSCMDELLIDPRCASGVMSAECDSLRPARQKTCTIRYEKCLNPQPRKGIMPIRPGRKQN